MSDNIVTLDLNTKEVIVPSTISSININSNLSVTRIKQTDNSVIEIISDSIELNNNNSVINVNSIAYENINHQIFNNHNLLINLDSDDHPQYLNNTRGDTRYYTKSEVDTFISNGSSDLTSHVFRTDNPHTVTATQIGLGNVDNTSDLNKPISTATQSALDGKVNTTGSITQISNRSHTDLTDIGTNTHLQIDSHISDTTTHFTQAEISIPASQISDFDTEVSNNIDVAANTANRHTHSNKTVLDNITASYTLAEETKLAGIEASANNYTLPSSVVHDTEVSALHATDALRISGSTVSLYKGDGTFESIVVPNTTYVSSDFDHNALTNYVANEHIDWTLDNVTNGIHINNIPTGVLGTTVALGNHSHTGVYEPADATILKEADLDVTVQRYNANTTLEGNTFNGAAQLLKLDVSGLVPIANLPQVTSVDKEYHTATAGQTVFNISGFTYEVGSSKLDVYVNGVKQKIATSYVETDSSTVTFQSGLSVGDIVEFRSIDASLVSNPVGSVVSDPIGFDATEGQTTFDTGNSDLSLAATKVMVFVNGIKQREGAGYSFTRSTSNIVFNEALNLNDFVEVIIIEPA